MQNNRAFTLVELIVVITILAILGTIAFISLQGYSSESRDSKRISDLGQIRIGLQLEQAEEGFVPMPDNAITVSSGSTLLTYQGYAGTGTLNNLRVSDNAKDPLEYKYYSYVTNASRTKFQLVTMLENSQTVYNSTNFVTKTYSNYENRKPYTIGDRLFTLLEALTNIPVQDFGLDIDLSTDTSDYIAVLDRNENPSSYSGSELLTKIIENTSIELIGCGVQPSYTNADFIVGEPTEKNQAWQNDDNTQSCYYECTNGYSGEQCDIAPPVTGDNVSTIAGEDIFYAGEYNPNGNNPRTIWVAGTENTFQWQTGYTSSNTTSTTDGRENTGTFNSDHPASYHCQTLEWGGYTDWYLPAMSATDTTTNDCSSQAGELQFLYCKHDGTGGQDLLGYGLNFYWSSTENNSSFARRLYFGDGKWYSSGKDTSMYVRCVRVASE